jgi:hypothetical protein
MSKIPIPKHCDLSSITTLRGFFLFYNKELAKNPDYGKKRAERERKQREYHRNKKES